MAGVNKACACGLHLLQARIVLLLHLIRGMFGVEVVGTLFTQRAVLKKFAVMGFMTSAAWKDIRTLIRRKLKRMRKSNTFAQHAEGLLGGFSGLHPIDALVFSRKARQAFE